MSLYKGRYLQAADQLTPDWASSLPNRGRSAMGSYPLSMIITGKDNKESINEYSLLLAVYF